MKSVAVVHPSAERRAQLIGTLGTTYKSSGFGRASEFLEQTRQTLPDLALVDYRLPDMTGVLLCRELREDDRTKRLSLVLMIPDGTEATVDECLVSGINDFIVEPISEKELLNKVHRLTHVPKRRPINTLIKISSDAGEGFFSLGRTLNISPAGVLIEVDKDLTIGQILHLQFFLPGDREPLLGRGRVKRRAAEAKTYHAGYGLEFFDISDADVSRIESYVRHN